MTRDLADKRRQSLLCLAQRRDPCAFDLLVMTLYNPVKSWLWRELYCRANQEDVCIDFYRHLYRYLPTFRGVNKEGRVVSLFTWLSYIMWSVAYADNRRTLKDANRWMFPETKGQVLPETISVVYIQAIQALPDSLRLVYSLRCRWELTTRETSKVCGISVNAVWQRLHRARRILTDKGL